MEQSVLNQLAEELFQAEEKKQPISPLTERFPMLNAVDAYHIQLMNIEKKVQAGQRIRGKKIGLTSLAMQRLANVHEPDYGHVMDQMLYFSQEEIALSSLLQPQVEVELSFLLKKTLEGPYVTALDVLAATECIIPTIEIVDSRIANWKLTLPDTVADNASSGLVVLGNTVIPPRGVDLLHIGMVLRKNGGFVNSGTGAAVFNHPANAVAWLANKLSEFGIALREGEIVLSGAFTAADPVQGPARYVATFGQWGEVEVTFH